MFFSEKDYDLIKNLISDLDKLTIVPFSNLSNIVKQIKERHKKWNAYEAPKLFQALLNSLVDLTSSNSNKNLTQAGEAIFNSGQRVVSLISKLEDFLAYSDFFDIDTLKKLTDSNELSPKLRPHIENINLIKKRVEERVTYKASISQKLQTTKIQSEEKRKALESIKEEISSLFAQKSALERQIPPDFEEVLRKEREYKQKIKRYEDLLINAKQIIGYKQETCYDFDSSYTSACHAPEKPVYKNGLGLTTKEDAEELLCKANKDYQKFLKKHSNFAEYLSLQEKLKIIQTGIQEALERKEFINKEYASLWQKILGLESENQRIKQAMPFTQNMIPANPDQTQAGPSFQPR